MNGWDFGISDGDNCMVAKNDVNGCLTICALNINSSREFDFCVNFNQNGSVCGFGTPDKHYSVIDCETEYLFYEYDNGDLSFTNVPKISTSTKSITKSSLTQNIAEGAYNVYDAGRNSHNLSLDLAEGRWSDFFKDLGDIINQDLINKLTKGGLPGLLLNERYNQILNEIHQHNSKYIYGNSSIRISSIEKQKDDSYVVHAEVSGLSSVEKIVDVYPDAPNPYSNLLDQSGFIFGAVENHIYAGIVYRKHYSAFIGYCTGQSKEVEVTNAGSEMYLSFVLPKLEKGTYKVKPYLRSSVNDILAKDHSYTYINYGDEKEINVIGGHIKDIEQADAQYNGENVNFVLYAHTEIDSNEGIEDWGVYYIKDGYYYRTSAAWPTTTSQDIRLEITLNNSEFDYIDYNKFTASKEMNFGVFMKEKNPTGNYDYMYYNYGDETSFNLEYAVKPSLVFHDAYIKNTNIIEQDEDNIHYETFYCFQFDIKGTFWIDSIQYIIGDASWTNNWESQFISTDGTYQANGRITYYSKSNLNHLDYYELYLRNGSKIRSSNGLTIGGYPGSPTIYVSGGSSSSTRDSTHYSYLGSIYSKNDSEQISIRFLH